MKLNKYQKCAEKYDIYVAKQSITGGGFIEKILGLVGEAGETADKFKKIIRDNGGKISAENKTEIVKELGDVLWYVAMISKYLDVPLDEVAHTNIAKLEDRYQRHKLSGSGDNR